ncbi:hypothetical protein LAWI1_G004725 [Lachnellula willkommii]|uniref:Cytochrome b561 domain-containing protein n=1 Tax=Lachnellula willkommii TaxID=215461 RepID=A0A559MBR3_9HELO|nr:hypothetical protein LAWI1_G004725 [Lachnellula willkommii]
MKFITSLFFSLLGTLWIYAVRGEPVQYCKFGSDENIDFCMGALMHQNVSTNMHDMFLTLYIRRYGGSALGWTAIGAGAVMEGSLMFIVYGDPLSQEQPIVSIRTVDGHHQPTLLAKTDLAEGMDLRVIRSTWLPDDRPGVDLSNAPQVAKISIICYSCPRWPGADISATSQSQPWIWAWNAKQEFDVFSFDAHLKMHKHHAGAGGWGNFYLDMRRSISKDSFPPSLPPIRPNIAAVGASDTPMLLSNHITAMTIGAGSYFHGILLATVFLLLLPAGVIGLLSSSPKSFALHWIIQLCASVLFLLGLTLGLLKRSKIDTAHQWVGIAICSSIGIQGLLGWWHHRVFVRLHKRTWISYAHIWLGRLVMIAGCSNILSGLFLRGYMASSAIVVLSIVVMCSQAMGLSGWIYCVQRKKKAEYTPNNIAWAKVDEDSFALTNSDDEDMDGDDKSEEDTSEEKTPFKRRSASFDGR